jgi:hypothetical protein
MATPPALIALAHDVLRQRRHPLESFFRPRGVAVVGATEAPGGIFAEILQESLRKQRLRAALGFTISNGDGGVVHAERTI